MKLFALISTVVAGTATAQVHSIQGSDTLAGLTTDVIVSAGLEGRVTYAGGGSSKGEKALIAGEQGLAPMSRAMKDSARAEAEGKGIEVVEHVIGLDGVGVFINSGNEVVSLTLDQVKKIFTCEITEWSTLGSDVQGEIKAYRRNDFSGTTDTFKSLVGIDTFGDCVAIAEETSDIALATSEEIQAIGFSGMSASRSGNRSVAVSNGGDAYEPTAANVRSFSYPLARKLYVYEAANGLNEVEAELLDYLLDPSFVGPILQDNDFFTVQ